MDIPRIIITGAGRSGTTFLVRLFTLCKMNTGFTEQEVTTRIPRCNAGLERDNIEQSENRVLKSPSFSFTLDDSLKRGAIVDLVIMPVRDIKHVAASRVGLGYHDGGFWKAKDLQSQIKTCAEAYNSTRSACVKHNIKLLELDFNIMVTKPYILFSILIRSGVKDFQKLSEEDFIKSFHVANKISRPLKQN